MDFDNKLWNSFCKHPYILPMQLHFFVINTNKQIQSPEYKLKIYNITML